MLTYAAKVKSGRKFLTSEKIAPSHLSGGSSAQRSQEGTSSSGVSTRTPEGSLDIVLVASKLEKIPATHGMYQVVLLVVLCGVLCAIVLVVLCGTMCGVLWC